MDETKVNAALDQLEEKVEEIAKVEETVEKSASETLKRSLEVSATLKDFVKAIGAHVDTVTAQFDVALKNLKVEELHSTVVELLKKVDVLSAQVEQLKPVALTVETVVPTAGTFAKAKSVTADETEVLEKNIENAASDQPNYLARKKNILKGLEKLLFKETPGTSEFTELRDTIIKFESSNEISDHMRKSALKSF